MRGKVSPKPVIKYAWCKGCGLCIAFCPKQVFEADSQSKSTVRKAEDCTGCKMCQYMCPDFAISMTEATPPSS